jgi:hypothetical protein
MVNLNFFPYTISLISHLCYNLCPVCLDVKYFLYFSVFDATENDGQQKLFLIWS